MILKQQIQIKPKEKASTSNLRWFQLYKESQGHNKIIQDDNIVNEVV